MPSPAQRPYRGVFPVAPTPFHRTATSTSKASAGCSTAWSTRAWTGICILANYSEQFLLTDAERDMLTRSLPRPRRRARADDRDREPFLDPHRGRARRQGGEGAAPAMLMLMPPYHGAGLRADETGMIEHFARIAEAGGMPIMVQDAPLSGVPLPVAFLARLAREVPLRALLQDRGAGRRREAARR